MQARHNVTVRWDVALNQRRIARFVFPRDDSALRIVLGAHLLPAFDIFILLHTGICSQARARFLRILEWHNRYHGQIICLGSCVSLAARLLGRAVVCMHVNERALVRVLLLC